MTGIQQNSLNSRVSVCFSGSAEISKCKGGPLQPHPKYIYIFLTNPWSHQVAPRNFDFSAIIFLQTFKGLSPIHFSACIISNVSWCAECACLKLSIYFCCDSRHFSYQCFSSFFFSLLHPNEDSSVFLFLLTTVPAAERVLSAFPVWYSAQREHRAQHPQQLQRHALLHDQLPPEECRWSTVQPENRVRKGRREGGWVVGRQQDRWGMQARRELNECQHK